MTGSIYFNQSELLGYTHNFNLWGDARHYSSTQNYTIRSYITGSEYSENVSGIWREADAISNYVKSGICGIYANNVYIGLGRVTNINFEESSDTRIRKYVASVEIPLLAGSGTFGSSGYINDTGFFFSGSDNFINYFASPTGRYIRNFTFNQSSEQISSGKYTYNKSASFEIDQGIYNEYIVSPSDYAKRLFGAISKSYGQEYILSPEYPNFYTLSSGISNTTQSFDVVNNQFSYDEKFTFQQGLNYLWQYNHSLDYDGKIITVDEKGTITSASVSGSKFNPALAAWGKIETGVYQRCSDVFSSYTGMLSYSGGCGLYNYPLSTNLTKNYCEATINYSRAYSTSPFSKSGYFYSYSNSVDYGEDGFVVISENGNFKATSNISGAGFQQVLTAYNSEKPSITGRISLLYDNSVLGGYNADCYHLSGGLKSMGKTESYKEYDPEVGYSWTFTDNPSYHEDSISYNTKILNSDSKSLHLFNYFPITNDRIIAQSSEQSTRGQYSNSISIISKSGVTVQQLIDKAISKVKKPSGTDIYATNYTYSFSPLKNNFSLNLDYVYSYYRNKDQFLAY